jgi:hypothetical protein
MGLFPLLIKARINLNKGFGLKCTTNPYYQTTNPSANLNGKSGWVSTSLKNTASWLNYSPKSQVYLFSTCSQKNFFDEVSAEYDCMLFLTRTTVIWSRPVYLLLYTYTGVFLKTFLEVFISTFKLLHQLIIRFRVIFFIYAILDSACVYHTHSNFSKHIETYLSPFFAQYLATLRQRTPLSLLFLSYILLLQKIP